jgi:hypothetical protein
MCVTASRSMISGQAKARQSMQSRDMDCFTAFAMTCLFMESTATWQSMTPWIAALRSQ